MRRLAPVVLIGLALAAACGDAPSDTTVRLRRVPGLTRATALAVRPDDPAVYVASRRGRVFAVRHLRRSGRVLDLAPRVRAHGERGLLGLAFSPDGRNLYVNFTGRNGDVLVEEYRFAHGRAEPSTGRELLRIPQPSRNHNGGQLAFGSDGMLYVGTGDGGVRGQDAQSISSLHGKILRIDPRPTATAAYSIPPDNPFANDPGARGEIWATGLRNPWRFSFDRATGDLWIGDVGEGRYEEIDHAPAPDRGRGSNFGWDVFEARSRRHPADDPATRFAAPLLALRHDHGHCAVVGGFVYRGQRLPSLSGAYVYSDYCAGDLYWLRQRDGAVVARGRLDVSVNEVTSLGEDGRGELYVLSLTDGVYRVEAADG